MLLRSGMDTALAPSGQRPLPWRRGVLLRQRQSLRPSQSRRPYFQVVRHLSKNPIGGKTPIQTKTLLVVRHQFKLKSRRGCLKNPLNVPIAKPPIHTHTPGRFGRGATAPPGRVTLRAGGVSPARTCDASGGGRQPRHARSMSYTGVLICFSLTEVYF